MEIHIRFLASICVCAPPSVWVCACARYYGSSSFVGGKRDVGVDGRVTAAESG